ncbi:LOB domain-containing protein 24-like [Panicum miliaceum]|uniref:LOB domain-containing protein 24-like n=1 Tax=Panicum miliaceum TaxID=4540 RepID=A0A3L6RJR8_PANMI|nr:LOB domain-containing protein 24-like [Panicum miliaceum]
MSSSAGGNMEEVVDHQQQLDYGGGGGGSSNPRRCAACKYLRRRCAPDCVLAPYFPASKPRRYVDVHAVFGTSNVTRVLQGLPVQERGRAADTMATEARWRVQDPVYGCTGIIDRLQQEIRAVQHELARTRAQLAVHARGAPPQGTQQPMLPLPPPTQPLAAAAAVAVHSGAHGVAVHDGDDEAPSMDADEFLDLDGRF